MSDEIVRQIIETRLQDNWIETQIDWDNIRFNPKRGDAFISPIISEDESEIKGINCIKRKYTLLIEVRVSKNSGTALVNSYATQLKNLFEGYAEDNFYCLKGRTERVGNSKQWHQRNVILQCRYTDYN